ncbi:unnamed protein product [Mytilus coruscus]|uniref:Uncharacterized protein n=1 Tax=Mytilus coruscus TaxID=42192 RepID=A0A6J8F1B2_MYTCO|nr:unnamed protein product [Mytilus coruscus]
MNTVCDHLSSEDNRVYITSGSFGEGLEMRGSDIDIMFVLKRIEVNEKITSHFFNPTKTYFSLKTEDTKPGFAMLCLISSPSHQILDICETYRTDNYLSNALFRKRYLNDASPVEHGPCVSDTDGLTHCLHSITWVKSASGWISRSNKLWPNKSTQQIITNYGEKQYKECVTLILYALSKCTLDKLIRGTELSVTQRLLVKWHLIYKQGLVRSLKFVLVDNIIFTTSAFIPMELLIVKSGYEIPPVVYAHFLSFLCHYHMNNVRAYRNSLRDLQLTIDEDYFMGKDKCPKALSYYCLGTAFQLMGDNVSAQIAFTETVKLLYPYPFLIRPLKRLSMTTSL